MTDDLSSELEAIAGSVPPIPNDYAALRSLIQNLPPPLAPDIRSAATGQVATTDPGLTAASQIANSLTGTSLGTESGASIGVVSELFYGNSNMLVNPLFELTNASFPNVDTTGVEQPYGWIVKYVLNSGLAPTTPPAFYPLYNRDVSNDNPLNSALMEMDLRADAGHAVDYTMYLYPKWAWTPSIDSALPYLVAALKVTLWGTTLETSPAATTFRARMEIVDATDDTTIRAFGPWLNLSVLDGTFDVVRLSAPLPRPAGGYYGTDGPFRWRLRVDYARPTAAAGIDVLFLGEPSLALASTQAPPPFSPIIAKWSPNYLSLPLAGDTQGRVQVDVSSYNPSTGQGRVRLGGGGSPDVTITRPAAKVLELAASSGGLALRFGGTAFPTAPGTGDLYFRTDLGMWFRYDGTRWVCTCRHALLSIFDVGLSGAGLTTCGRAAPPPLDGCSDIWLERIECSFFVSGGTALSGTNKWVGVVTKQPANTTLATFNIDSGASSVWRRSAAVDIDALLTASTQFELETGWTKTGTPGNLYAQWVLNYRLVAT